MKYGDCLLFSGKFMYPLYGDSCAQTLYCQFKHGTTTNPLRSKLQIHDSIYMQVHRMSRLRMTQTRLEPATCEAIYNDYVFAVAGEAKMKIFEISQIIYQITAVILNILS